MLLSLDDIKGSSAPIDNIFSKEDVNENYFYSALNFITESNKEIVKEKKKLYRSIAESTDLIAVNESFQGFYEKVTAIIDKIIKFIKSLVNKFIIGLNKFINSDKYLRNHINDLADFKSTNEFTIKGYNFTFKDDIPSTQIFAEFNKEFIGLDFSKLINKDKKQQLEYLNSVRSKLQNFSYDKLRGEILKVSYDISEKDYPNELFLIFRDGVDKKFPINITIKEVNLSKKNFLDYNRVSTDVRNQKKEIETSYNNIKKDLKRIVKKNEEGDLRGLLFDPDEFYYGDDEDNHSKSLSTLNDSAKEKINLYIKSKTDQITKISDIHTMAFSSKLEALKCAFKQDKEILYKALSKVQSNAYKKVKINEESTDLDTLEVALFFEQESLNNIELSSIVKEAQLINERKNSIDNINILNEAVVDSAKAAILKVVKVIGTIWKKFVEQLDSLFNINKKNYLDKYRDIILKKQLNPENSYTMYNYPQALKSVLNNATMPQFNYEGMKNYLDSQTNFVNHYLNNFAPNYDEKDNNNNDLRSAFIKTFRGSAQEQEIPASQIKMVDLFNYCYNYQNIVKNVQKDLDTVKAGAKAGLKLIDDMVAKNQAGNTSVNNNQTQNTNINNAPKPNPAPAANNGGNPKPSGNGTASKHESFVYEPLNIQRQYYSNLFEAYINEFEVNKTGSNPEGLNSTYANKGSNINNTQVKNPDSKNDDAIKGAVANNGDKQIQTVKDQINNYIRVATTFLNAKKDVFIEIYKIYMIIIKNHIRENLKNAGKNDNTNNTEPGTATQYQSGSNDSMVDNAMNGKEESAILNESIFNNKEKQRQKELKKEVDYLEYLINNGITISEFKSKYLNELIRLWDKTSDKVANLLDQNNVDPKDVEMVNFYDKKEKATLTDFSILENGLKEGYKTYTMKQIFICAWNPETVGKNKSLINKMKQIGESVIGNKSEDYDAWITGNQFYIVCKQWIYDPQIIKTKLNRAKSQLK